MPILSGGTGFYVQSLLEGFDFSVEGPNPGIRERLDELWQTKGDEGLLVYAEELAKKAVLSFASPINTAYSVPLN